MVQKPLNANEDLLGYRLKERIGAGGYGEVWSAEAPGGIMKAVKIVFGYHDERRAQTELKSLDRVKALRHPFLLNLERIDVVDGQLVIITELADKSMADEFNEFVLKGEVGIPRQYLLNQLLEAADALDYISEKHSLQHLDVKPENLLLVGRHIKVADFGLVKDLQDVSQSLMGGLTPAYAAPELFDGRPSNTSDQYSLAIVYQEMLTGQRPFPGTTPAALAAQHMNGKPNLRPLPKGDQLVIAKALSKDPSVRFPNCISMIQELINRHNQKTKSPNRKIAPTRKPQDTESKKIQLRNNILPTEATQLLNNSVYQDTPTKAIDAPDCSELTTVVQPTLFIGVGNSANQVMRDLRKKMIERFGHMDNIPSVQVLCVDTDRTELANLSRFNDGYDLTAAETVALPLRKPEDYRIRQKSILNWLSRRWIYNVPRTLKTEGIRPLGRLALIDNFEVIYERLQQAFEQLGKPELLAKTAETVGLEPGNVEPSVFIVSSISGGTGSGMLNDLAYATKLVLSEFGKPRDCVHGLMMHSTSQSAGDPGLAATNSFAFLTELRHFTQFGYPGDDSQGLPDLPDEAPFESNYFLDLGNDLSPEDLSQKFNDIAEYLFLNTLSKSAKFFVKCRDFEDEIEHFALRSFGISTCGIGNTDCYQELVDQLCSQIVAKWTKGDANSIKEAQAIVDSFDHEEILVGSVHSSIEEQIQSLGSHKDIEEFRQSLIQNFGKHHDLPREQLIEETEAIFGMRDGNAMASPPPICQTILVSINEKSSLVGKTISDAICSLLYQERLDLSACQRAAGYFEQHIIEQRESVRAALAEVYQEIEQHEEALILWHFRSGNEDNLPISSAVESFLSANLKELHLRHIDRFFQKLAAQVGNISELIRQYIGQLNTTIASRFSAQAEFQDADPVDRIFAQYLQQHLPSLLGTVELQLYHELIDEHGGYGNVLEDQNCSNYLVPEALRKIAQSTLAVAAKNLDVAPIIKGLDHSSPDFVNWVQDLSSKSAVLLDECGGEVQKAIILPADTGSTEVANQIADDETRCEVLRGTFGDVTLVGEAHDVPLANVAFRLLQFRPDCIELTKRLQTRSDVDWISLGELL